MTVPGNLSSPLLATAADAAAAAANITKSVRFNNDDARLFRTPLDLVVIAKHGHGLGG